MKFVVDKMLGRLGRWLRILGYDAQYFSQPGRQQLILESFREDRMILTRDVHLKEKKGLKLLFIRSDFVRQQVKQVIGELKLEVNPEKFFTRCLNCNRPVQEVGKEKIEGKVPPFVYQTHNKFSSCPSCGKIYWKGTHWDKFQEELKSLGD